MFEGIENAFVIKNFFGDKNVFEGAKLVNVDWQMASSRVELSIQVYDKPLKVSKGWGDFESIYIVLGIYGLVNLEIDVKEKKVEIEKFDMYKMGDMHKRDQMYCMEISMNNGQKIKCIFDECRVQHIKPLETGTIV